MWNAHQLGRGADTAEVRMTNRETFVAMLAQTLAPKFFEISGDVPEEMGFPFGDSKEDFDERMERQFNPVDYWTAKATEYAEGLATIFEAGGVDLSSFDYDAAVSAMLAFRADLKDPNHPQHELVADDAAS